MITFHVVFAPFAVASGAAVDVVESPPVLAQDIPPVEVNQEKSPTVHPIQQLPLLFSQAEVEDPPLVLPSVLINRIVAGISGTGAKYDYIELYNPNSHDVFVDSWRLVVLRGTAVQQTFTIHGTIKAKSYILAADDIVGSDQFKPDFLLESDLVYVDGVVQLVDKSNTIVEQVTWGGSAPLASDRMLDRKYSEEVPYLTGAITDFTRDNPPVKASTERAGGYVPYVAPVYRCTGLAISEIAANLATEKQFVELYNSTSLPIILDGCLLQTNRSITKSYVLIGTLNPGKYRSVPIASTGLTLTKTTSGTVYLLSSDGQEETDVRSYDGLAAETSWSWFGGSDWRQTFSLSAGVANTWQEFLPCEKGYERNQETGRCRKIVVETPLADCEPGKYRNPETGRCRAVMVADALTPCKLGQYRNPETNRCRSLATTANTLKPCKPNQQRNPDTNRCRNTMSSIPGSAFAIEPIKETGKAFIGWWALGGIGVLAIGYGIWEWRSEMLAGIRKLGSFFTSSK